MVRDATAADMDCLIALGRKMHAESWYRTLPFDGAKVQATLERLVAMPEGYVRVFERDGAIVGGFVGVISELWFCRERCASDLALFVESSNRGGVVAARLIADFVAWADAQGVAEKCLAVSTGVQKEATGRLYEHFNFTHVGGIYKQQGAACARG